MRFAYRAAGPLAAAAVLTLLSACSRTQQDWRAAQQAGTARAYAVFVRRHPGSELAGVARQRIEQLTEGAAWQQATQANTAESYRGYLAKYPNGSWSQDARIRMESRSLGSQPLQPLQPLQPTQRAVAAMPAAAEPATIPGPAASAQRPDARGAAVQLGAFSSVSNARGAWGQLSSRFRAQLGGLTPETVPVFSSGRRLYRLQARVADVAAARRLCHQLQQHSQGCLPLP